MSFLPAFEAGPFLSWRCVFGLCCVSLCPVVGLCHIPSCPRVVPPLLVPAVRWGSRSHRGIHWHWCIVQPSGGICHHLSMRLNCLTGLNPGIVSIIVISPVTSMFHMLMLSFPAFPHSLRLALGQRPSPMYYSSCPCLVGLCAALEGLLLLCLLYDD